VFFLESGSSLLGDLYGGLSILSIGEEQIQTTFAFAHFNSTLQLPLLSASNDGYISTFQLSTSDWQLFEDEIGSALIPLLVRYEIVTMSYSVTVVFLSRVVDYIRAPVVVEDLRSAELKLFSDFRAPHNEVNLTILQRDNNKILYSGKVEMNAVEFAYEADLGGLSVKQAGEKLRARKDSSNS